MVVCLSGGSHLCREYDNVETGIRYRTKNICLERVIDSCQSVRGRLVMC